MKAEVEIYKGIEFVRLSSLKTEQSAAILDSSFARKTIKVLRDNELLSDCLPYSIYLEWYHQEIPALSEVADVEFAPGINGLKLALK